MDHLRHPELWGTIRPGSRSFGDERADPRFNPPGDSTSDHYHPNIPEGQPLSNLDADEQIFNPGPRLEGEGWPSTFRWLRDRAQEAHRDAVREAGRLHRFIRKNWFWVLAAVFTAVIYINDYTEGLIWSYFR
jgi:hypothetical protein